MVSSLELTIAGGGELFLLRLFGMLKTVSYSIGRSRGAVIGSAKSVGERRLGCVAMALSV